MFCMKCGSEIRENAKFCVNCGAPMLVAEPAENAAPIIPPPEPQPIENDAPIIPPPEPQPIENDAPIIPPPEPQPIENDAPIVPPSEPQPKEDDAPAAPAIAPQPIESEPPVVPAPEPQEPQPVYQPYQPGEYYGAAAVQPPAEPDAQPPKKKKKKLLVFLIILGVVAVLVAAFFVYQFYAKSQYEEPAVNYVHALICEDAQDALVYLPELQNGYTLDDVMYEFEIEAGDRSEAEAVQSAKMNAAAESDTDGFCKEYYGTTFEKYRLVRVEYRIDGGKTETVDLAMGYDGETWYVLYPCEAAY